MRKFRLITVLLAFTLLFTGCGKKKVRADMSGYEGFEDSEHVYYESSVDEMLSKVKKNDSFVVYFGFTNCPWCIEIVPILNELAKEADEEVLYVNTRADESWTSNMDITDYDKLVEYLGDYLTLDADGNPHLYTPAVIFIKDGEVVLYHSGTVEGHDAHERKMMQAEIDQLSDTYRQGFEAIK